MKWLKKLKAKVRLKRIELATGIKLRDWQKKIVLDRNQQYICAGRREGKTITAIFWTLMWRKAPISRRTETAMNIYMKRIGIDRKPAIPDPDATDNNRIIWTLQEYEKYALMCEKARIKVAHVTK